MSIRRRFIIFSIIWGIAPVIISTIICITSFMNKNMEVIRQNVSALSIEQSMNLQSFFEQNIRDLNINSNVPIIRDLLVNSNNGIDDEKQRERLKIVSDILNGRINEQDFLVADLIFNSNGIIIKSNNDEYVNKKIIISDEEIKKLKNNEVVITDIIERYNFNHGIKCAIIAKPIFFRDEYQGALASVINMKFFEDITNKVHFFQTEKVLIVDKKLEIASSNSEDLAVRFSGSNKSNSLYEQLKSTDLDKRSNGTIEYEINNKKKTGYYYQIGNSGWTIICSVELDEFKEPINKIIKDIIILLIVIIVLIIVSYIAIINYFSKPIYRLLEVIRKIRQGRYKDRFIYNKNNEFGEIATAFNDLIDNIDRNRKSIEEKNRSLQSLTSNIPGGVYRFKIENDEYILDYVSAGYLELLGYKKYQFKEIVNKKIFDFIYKKDVEAISNEMKEQISKNNTYSIVYRVKRKDGTIVWLLDNGQIVKKKDGNVISYSVVINITEAKQNQEELRLSEERYSIILSQTEDIIFEWNVNEDTIHFSKNYQNKFKFKSIIYNISEKIYDSESIYRDDMRKLGKVLNDIICGSTYKETEIRIKNSVGEYIWCKIRMTAMFNEEENVFKVIGVIIDIHNEKRESEKLLFKAQRDSLTGLYNKGTVQSMIESYIENSRENFYGALFIIDLDNFKAINDNLGHLAGDFVLASVSSMFQDVFNENSIIGRIGGDEFIIFLSKVESEEILYDKAQEVIKGFKIISIREVEDYEISGSIGIAKYPEHGKSFKELFTNADKAVYSSKNKGKDTYSIFEDSL